MDRLPYELLEAIFSEALMDGGRSACNLRSVSKSMCALMEPFRFYHIAGIQWSIEGVARFLAIFKAASSASQRGGIRHLAIFVRHYENVSELITLAAPTLRTADIYYQLPAGFIEDFRHWLSCSIQFPQLTDLSMGGLSAVDHLVLSPDKACLFPLLKSLHLSFLSFNRLGPVHKTAQSIIAATSQTSLSHVRLLQVDVAFTPSFWGLLRFVLGLAPPEFLDSIGEADLLPLPPCVKEFVITIRPSSMNRADFREADSIQARLQDLAKEAAEQRGLAFSMLPPFGHQDL
ncbi:hypothetical protein OE88DRAFT_1736688 [Heliocybe sulcata]|uniref:F-box domain-containing protein n=1 Tax=Heliocybe sulcata TaxID=5364 RepID=A0A5C3MW16_9AGAM|nr:hypothetical protein OE88DRAFT_1736688 [Heliocybe sulcata]